MELCRELAQLHALESLRTEHRLEMAREAETLAAEHKWLDAWVQDLRDSHKAEEYLQA